MQLIVKFVIFNIKFKQKKGSYTQRTSKNEKQTIRIGGVVKHCQFFYLF